MVRRSVKNLAKAVLPGRVTSRLSNQRGWTAQQTSPRFSAPLDDVEDVLGCCIAYTPSGGYCVPLSSRHRPAAQRILEGGVYEPETIEFVAANCLDGDIVHAGTYFGDFLPALSRACAPQARIWAFEPNPENFRCASVTCALNGLRNVDLQNCGLGAERDRAVMQVQDLNGQALGGASKLLRQAPEVPAKLTAQVSVVALDDIVPSDREVSVVQLDVEGFEQQALSGALQTISRCLPILVLETVPEDAWLASNILNLGYRIDREVHGNRILMPPS